MTITFLSLYNDVTGQAWSMFDGDVETFDEFEKAVTTSIQKALNNLWNFCNFPFRKQTKDISVKSGVYQYPTPNGNISKTNKTYDVKINNSKIEFVDSIDDFEVKTGAPTCFTIKNDKICLYPTPDKIYELSIDYWSTFPCKDSKGTAKATLENDTDYIDISAKYEDFFKMALLPLCMMYAIASKSDENYSGYKQQYNDALRILIDNSSCIPREKRIGW